MDHPSGIERPYVHQSDAEKKLKTAERRRELEFKSRAHDLERVLGREKAEALAYIVTGFKPKD